MRPRENFVPLVAVGFGLTLAILGSFQLYILREPARVASDMARDQAAAVAAGRTLFAKNCSLCHGDNGEGANGPSLNDKVFLSTTSDDTVFSLVSSGVPGSQMPAWNQSHGGPLTDEDIRQVVAFIRAWEPTAPDRRATPLAGDARRGAVIFAGICYACHGDHGQGTDRAPAINNLERLKQFDDAWYRDTITQGRPSKGMPTWGTVLSPAQIADLLALIDQWRLAPPATPTPPPANPSPAPGSTPEPAPGAEGPARPSNPGGPGLAVSLRGDPAAGAAVYTANCQKCHAEQGKGGVLNPGSTDGTIPALNPIDPTLVDKDLMTFAVNLDLFIEHGSTPEGSKPAQIMPAWGDEKKLTPQQIADVIAYLIALNPAP